MALHRNLPIYHATYGLLRTYTEFTRRVQRDLRYSIVERGYNHLMEVILDIYRANDLDEDKTTPLKNAKECMIKVEVICRLLNEMHQISDGQEGILIEKIDEVEKQLSNWLKYFDTHKSPLV